MDPSIVCPTDSSHIRGSDACSRCNESIGHMSNATAVWAKIMGVWASIIAKLGTILEGLLIQVYYSIKNISKGKS